MIVGRANALTALGLLLLLLVVVLTAPRWTKLLTRSVPDEEGASTGVTRVALGSLRTDFATGSADAGR